MHRGKTVTTLHGAFDEQASQTPNATAVVSHGIKRHTLTYDALCARSTVLARGLGQFAKDSGIVDGEFGRKVLAVQLSRTHLDFTAVLIAASRLGMPFVLLSTDLPDKNLEDQRNKHVIQVLQPSLCIVGSKTDLNGNAYQATIDEVVNLGAEDFALPESAVRQTSEVLCFMFTGGTQRTKVVKVTHAMVLHERTAYLELWRPRGASAVVLAHTSVYWGATAIGQLSIALAYGGTIVWTEAAETSDLQKCIAQEGVTVLGVVPDHLDLLGSENPSKALPDVEVVFTWGERLPRSVSNRWRGHPKAILRELLIATEYWLSLWRDPHAGDDKYNIVSGTELLVLKECGDDAVDGELGELCLAGPMVMAGYHNAGDPNFDQEYRITVNGRVYYRTHDLVLRVPRGIVYKGRADMMAKDKGKWVDMLFVEEQVAGLSGIRAAKVIPDLGHEHFHVCIVIDEGLAPGPVLDAVRSKLLPRMQLWVLPELPRHAVTRKVVVPRLQQMLSSDLKSWPVEGDPRFAQPSQYLSERLSELTKSYITWWLIKVGVLWVLADDDGVAMQMTLVVVFLGSTAIVTSRSERHQFTLTIAFIIIWLAASAILKPPSFRQVTQFAVLCFFTTYFWLATIYADSFKQESRIASITSTTLEEIPLRRLGIIIIFCLALHSSWSLCRFLSAVLFICGAAYGMFVAGRKGRLLAWPILLWTCLGCHTLHWECGQWLEADRWRREVLWKATRFKSFLMCGFAACMKPLGRRGEEVIVPDLAKNAESEQSQATSCAECNSDADGNAVKLEAAALAWLTTQLSATVQLDSASKAEASEPKAKRQRTCQFTMLGNSGSERQLNNMNAINGDTNGHSCMNDTDFKAWGKKVIERWWWFHHHTDVFDLSTEESHCAAKVLCGSESQQCSSSQGAKDVPLEARFICSLVATIEPLLKPVHLDSLLLGLDSLRIARLANAIRVHLGYSFTVARLRGFATVNDLYEAIQQEALDSSSNHSQSASEFSSEKAVPDDSGREYAVWFSPGQYRMMGPWVLRTDHELDRAALIHATQRLVDRHAALRVQIVDPLNYWSIICNGGALFTLYAPLLDAAGWLLHGLRRLISWALIRAWPRISCHTRHEMYGERFPETAAPVHFVEIDEGQDWLEYELKHRRHNLPSPGAITAITLRCYLVDAWVCSKGWEGKACGFVILRVPDCLSPSVGAELAYVDTSSGEWGPLLSPMSDNWRCPPYGFPALFFAPLGNESYVWIRLEKADELRICYKSGGGQYHVKAFRADATRGREVHPPVVVHYLSLNMFHSFADGNCYLPLVQDLMAFYDAARGVAAPILPPLDNVFEELERRLLDTFNCWKSPMRSSMRGGIWGYGGKGYRHTIGLEPEIMAAIARSSVHYRVPLDLVLLGLVMISKARADSSDFEECTLYAPMRDGPTHGMMVGLFADWRDLSISIDFEFATTLGTIMQIAHKIQHRQWTVFNCLKKPERTVVNIQPLDFEQRAGFMNLGENMWHGGDQLSNKTTRSDVTEKVHQPAGFTIEQQDEGTWWILCSAGYDCRATPWMRRFLFAFREALKSFLIDPLALVHRKMPDEDTLLRQYEGLAVGSWMPTPEGVEIKVSQGPHIGEESMKKATEEASPVANEGEPERRIHAADQDRIAYTKEEFIQFAGRALGEQMWGEAMPAWIHKRHR